MFISPHRLHRFFIATISLCLLLNSSSARTTAQAQARAYVTNTCDNAIVVIDTDTNKVVTTVTVGLRPRGVAITPDGARVWTLTDVVTDSAGASWRAYFMIAVGTTCSGMTPPSSAHNTIPLATSHPNHVLPAGSTSTTLFVAPIEPEGWSRFTTSVSGYTFGADGDFKMPTALTHSWSQTAGPVSATITNGNTLRPAITGLTSSGTYTFRYTGTDQQSDSVQVSINVTVP